MLGKMCKESRANALCAHPGRHTPALEVDDEQRLGAAGHMNACRASHHDIRRCL